MKKQSTMGGFAILSSAVLIVKILSLLYIPILLHILGREGYGIYAAAYQVFILIFAVTNSGLPQAISKIVSELIATENYRDAVKAFKMARFLLVTGGVIMSVILVIIAWPAAKFAGDSRSYWAVLALCPTIILSTLTSSYRGYFQGRKNMIPTAVSQVLEQVVNFIFTLLLAYVLMKYGLAAACAGGSFATSIAALFAAGFLILMYHRNRESRITRFHNPEVSRLENKALFKKILNYSIPLTIYQAMFYIGNLIDVGNTHSRLTHSGFSKGMATILYGDLNRFYQLIGVPNAVIASLSVALLPSISASAARNEKKVVRQKINSAFKISFMISIPAAFALSILSAPFYRLLGFGPGSYIMLYGSYVLILMSSVQIFSAILQGLGKLYIVTFFLIFGVVGKIVTNYFVIAIPKINIMGAIIGNVVYYTLPLVLDSIILLRILKVKVNIFKHAVKPLISSIGMAAVLFVVYHGGHSLAVLGLKLFLHGTSTTSYIATAIGAVAAIPAGTYAYFYLMAVLKGIRQRDLQMLPAKAIRLLPSRIKAKISE